jgi:hypothetical protein
MSRSRWYRPAWGCFLPAGNRDEFPLMRELLHRRGVHFDEFEIRGAHFFVMPDTEKRKLPRDRKGPYIPVTEDSGHSIFEVTVFQIANICEP